MAINNIQNYRLDSYGLSQFQSTQTNLGKQKEHFMPSDVSNLQRRSDIATSLKTIIMDISAISKIKHNLIIQQKALLGINQTNSYELNSKYTNMYNEAQENIDKGIESLVESKDYFDGLYGAPKLNISEMIKNAKEKAKDIEDALEKTNKKILQLQYQATKTIDKEMIRSKEYISSSFDFGKESSDFSANNLNNIAGSIVFAQGNVNVSQVQKQVLY